MLREAERESRGEALVSERALSAPEVLEAAGLHPAEEAVSDLREELLCIIHQEPDIRTDPEETEA